MMERQISLIPFNADAVTPALDDSRRAKVLSLGVGAIFVAIGISAASVYAWAWEGTKGALRYLLRIN
jgi:hypothetical protein